MLAWYCLQGITNPQELAAGIGAVSAHCTRVLESKEGALAAVQAVLTKRDEQYVKLLQLQAEETDALIEVMHAQHAALRAVQEEEMETVETSYLQVRQQAGDWVGCGGSEGWQGGGGPCGQMARCCK